MATAFDTLNGESRPTSTETIKFLECLENDLKKADLSEKARREKQFLHNQHFRYLMHLRGMTEKYFPPENGGSEFYNYENLKRLYEKLKKNPTHLLIGWGDKLKAHKMWIELLKESPVDYNIRLMKKSVDSLASAVCKSKMLSEVISCIISHLDAILFTDNCVKDHPFEDCYIHTFPENKQIVPLYDLILLWKKDKLKTRCSVCNGKVSLFQIIGSKVRSDWEWRGYCPFCNGTVSGVSSSLDKMIMPLYDLDKRYERSVAFLR